MSSLVWLLLLVVVAVVAVAVLRRRSGTPSAPPPPSLPESDDLSTLGLSEVRARPAEARPVERADPDQARFEDVPRLGDARPAEARRPTPRPEAPADDAPSRPAWGDDAGAWGEAPVRYLLRSLAARVGGPVAVVRHEGGQFRVAARTDGGPLASIRGASLGLAGPARLIRADLGGLAVLVGGEARAVPLGPYVVLIGGSGEAEPGYLDLLATLAGAPAPARPAAEGPKAPGAKASGAKASGAKASKKETPAAEPDPAEPPPAPDGPPVPRAAIIAEEQAAAKADDRALAFALVTLADAEDRLTRGTATAVAAAEAELRERLASAPDVRRVEPFGDLLFGVFLDLAPEPTAAWCDRLASGAPPLFIGAVAPADGDPTGIRDAAAEALHDAYDQRRSRVVEV